jgi:hypothetical protein
MTKTTRLFCALGALLFACGTPPEAALLAAPETGAATAARQGLQDARADEPAPTAPTPEPGASEPEPALPDAAPLPTPEPAPASVPDPEPTPAPAPEPEPIAEPDPEPTPPRPVYCDGVSGCSECDRLYADLPAYVCTPLSPLPLPEPEPAMLYGRLIVPSPDGDARTWVQCTGAADCTTCLFDDIGVSNPDVRCGYALCSTDDQCVDGLVCRQPLPGASGPTVCRPPALELNQSCTDTSPASEDCETGLRCTPFIASLVICLPV